MPPSKTKCLNSPASCSANPASCISPEDADGVPRYHWDTIESHHLFEKSGADYAALGVIVKSVVAEPPVLYQVNFKSDNGLTIPSTSAA
ncbi:hypothetical protein VF21_03045 [Pseudogymnoascus sp. 05NY08]|nr:hypothetical protein VF21_03045 [Pseudogymnoascus sp. 05NY08]